MPRESTQRRYFRQLSKQGNDAKRDRKETRVERANKAADARKHGSGFLRFLLFLPLIKTPEPKTKEVDHRLSTRQCKIVVFKLNLWNDILN